MTAFGDVFVETESGEVWIVSPIEIECKPVARSVAALEQLFADPEWVSLTMLTGVALLARDRGMTRPADKVFGLAPHPCFTGSIMVERLQPMDLAVWHSIATQLRTTPSTGDGPTS